MARYIIDNQKTDIVWEGLDDTGRILQNAKNLLRVQTGEVPYDRLRGMDAELRHMNIAVLKAEITKRVHEALLWENRAKLISTEVALNEDGSILIQATVEV